MSREFVNFFIVKFVIILENTFNKEPVYYPCFTPTNKSMTPHIFSLYSTLLNEFTHTQILLIKKGQKIKRKITQKKKPSDLERESDQSPPQQPSNHHHCNNHNHAPPKTTTTATNFSLIDQIRLRSGDHGRNSWLPPTPNSWLPHTPKSLSQIRSGYHRGAVGDGADNSIEAARRE